jgi:hypothetical protein
MDELRAALEVAQQTINEWVEDEHGRVHVHKDVIKHAVDAAALLAQPVPAEGAQARTLTKSRYQLAVEHRTVLAELVRDYDEWCASDDENFGSGNIDAGIEKVRKWLNGPSLDGIPSEHVLEDDAFLRGRPTRPATAAPVASTSTITTRKIAWFCQFCQRNHTAYCPAVDEEKFLHVCDDCGQSYQGTKHECSPAPPSTPASREPK